jgi:hypothetical protein
MMMPYNDPNPFAVNSGFNPNVDFCIWILEQDGLQVPPFSYHPNGNSRFRELGLSATDWLKWFGKIIKSQDQRLTWHFENPESQNEFWPEQQYQQALVLAGNISRNDAQPSDFWTGNEEILNLLSQFWQVYSFQTRERAQALEDDFIRRIGTQNRSDPFRDTYEKLKDLQDRPDVLQINQVGYPYAIEYLLSPVYIVVSLENGLQNDLSFSQSILRATQRLIVINKSSG